METTEELITQIQRKALDDTRRNLFFGEAPSSTAPDDLPDVEDDDEWGSHAPTIDDVINDLQKLKEEHGNLPVYFDDNEYGICGFYFRTQEYNGRKVLTIED